jgi:subtilisin family serine protease
MRRSLIPAALSALLVLSLFVPPSGAAGRSQAATQSARRPQKAGYQAVGQFVPGEVLVKFRQGVTRGVELAAHAAMGARVLNRIAGGLGVDHVKLPRGLTVAEAVRRYSSSPLVEYAEPNAYRFPAYTPNDTSYGSLWGLNNTGQSHPISDGAGTSTGTPDADMDVAEAWDLEKGDPNVVIAVLDSGVDVAQQDLAGNIWQNPLEAGGTPLVDDDGNGYVDDVNGRDTAEDDNTLLEPNAAIAGFDHGTHVAGTIAAVTNNATGVSGVCGGDGTANSGCKIMVVKFMDAIDTDGDLIPDSMAGELSAELEGIAYARSEGADFINGSFGAPFWSNAEREAFRLAGVNSGILSILAGGNDSLDNDTAMAFDLDGDGAFDIASPAYPASYNLAHILTVAASNHNDEYAYFTACATGNPKWVCAFTNFGRFSVDVAAPGVDILSTTPSNTYSTFAGTSMAAPHVAGVAGLVQAYDLSLNAGTDTLSAVDVKNKIMNSVDTTDGLGSPLDLNNSMWTQLFTTKRPGKFTRTAGRVNALDALTGATTNASPNHDGDIPGATGMSGSKLTGSLAWPGDVNDIRKKRLTRNKTYRFTLVVPSGRDFDLYLLKSDTKEIWQPGKLIRASFGGPGADETFTYKPGATKTFFIHMTWFFGGNGNYTLKVVCIKNC